MIQCKDGNDTYGDGPLCPIPGQLNIHIIHMMPPKINKYIYIYTPKFHFNDKEVKKKNVHITKISVLSMFKTSLKLM